MKKEISKTNLFDEYINYKEYDLLHLKKTNRQKG